jgi:hypothetical protein
MGIGDTDTNFKEGGLLETLRGTKMLESEAGECFVCAVILPSHHRLKDIS